MSVIVGREEGYLPSVLVERERQAEGPSSVLVRVNWTPVEGEEGVLQGITAQCTEGLYSDMAAEAAEANED